MEDRAGKIACAPVSEPTDNVRMADSVQSDGFVLKVLDQCALKIGIEVVLKENVQCLDNDLAMRGLRRRKGVTRDEDLGVTPAPEKFDYVVTFVDPAIA
jgi:hypothetical protein